MNFYLTTTLPYVNSDPHMGFALELVQADALARWQVAQGKELFFNTGTDEHGVKIFRKAEELGKDPQVYCDEMAARFEALTSALNICTTAFIRTTNVEHKAAAQEFWKRCLAKGDIYKKSYQVKYCVGCELEKTDSELEDGRCPIHPNMDMEKIDEENYFFRFSKYQEALLKLYKDRPDFVLPAHRLTEIQKFVERGLEDFSISRLKSKMPWGVPVPDDSEQVMYVWFDALINYISTLGWPHDEENFKKWWPGVQIAGKDNLRQQSAMWQAMLLSADLPTSQQVLIHGFITAEGQKMSKSLGNVVDPFAVAKTFGVDALRYYLLREIPTSEDGDFSMARFRSVYQDDLQNTIGNLMRRVIAMTVKYFEGKVPEGDGTFLESVAKMQEAVNKNMADFDCKAALEAVLVLAREGNKTIEDEKPWELAKNNSERLAPVMGSLLHLCRVLAKVLAPFTPEASEKALDQLGGMDGVTVYLGDPLFPALPEETA